MAAPARSPRDVLNRLIKASMKERGLTTLDAFADHVGLSRTTISKLVREPAKVGVYPSLETLLRLAEGLGRPTHELLYLLSPDAPGASITEAATRRDETRAWLRAMSASLIETDTFLATRAEDFRKIQLFN